MTLGIYQVEIKQLIIKESWSMAGCAWIEQLLFTKQKYQENLNLSLTLTIWHYYQIHQLCTNFVHMEHEFRCVMFYNKVYVWFTDRPHLERTFSKKPHDLGEQRFSARSGTRSSLF